MLTQIRSIYFWIKVAVTKILTIDFYNLQKKGKKIFPDEGCLVCCCKETWYLKSCQTSFQKRIQPPLVSVIKQCQKTWLFIIIFSAIRVWKLNDWVALQMSSIINAAYEQRLFTMLSSNLIKMFKVKRNILTLYEKKFIKSIFSSVLVFCFQNFEIYIDISSSF